MDFGLSWTRHNISHLQVFLLVIFSAFNAPPLSHTVPRVNSFKAQLSCHLFKEVFIIPLPKAESISSTWCSYCTFYILLSQKLSHCVIVHISTLGTSWLESLSVSSLRKGFLWSTYCSSIGVWHIGDTHSLSEKCMHNFLFPMAIESKTQAAHEQSECVSLPPVCPCSRPEMFLGWGRVFMLKVLKYNPKHPVK